MTPRILAALGGGAHALLNSAFLVISADSFTPLFFVVLGLVWAAHVMIAILLREVLSYE